MKKIVNEINQSQSKGQDLMIEFYLVGYLFGKEEIKSVDEVKSLIQQLSSIKKQMDDGEISSFSRDYFINQKLKGLDEFHQGGQLNNIQQTKKQGIIQEDEALNIYKNEDQESKEQNCLQKLQNTQEKEKNKFTLQTLNQKEELEEKRIKFLKQSQKNYNTRISKVVQNSKVNQNQN